MLMEEKYGNLCRKGKLQQRTDIAAFLYRCHLTVGSQKMPHWLQ